MVMDHFYQLPMLGPPEHEMFEAYTLLGALAARTKTVKLGTLVTGVTYRNPAILAKIVTTLDVISKGRAFLGIGAAWFDVEHDGLGVDFPPVKERFERLEEALQICRAMFRGERPTFEGKHYRVEDAINSPRPIHAGRAADHDRRAGREEDAAAHGPARRDGQLHRPASTSCPASSRCSPATAPTSAATWPPSTRRRCARSSSARRWRPPWPSAAPPPGPGPDWDGLDDATQAWSAPASSSATPTPSASRCSDLIGLGLDGITVNLPTDGHDPEAVRPHDRGPAQGRRLTALDAQG